MTLQGASPKALVLTVPMATVVNLRPAGTDLYAYMQTKPIRISKARRADSSLYQLTASQSHSQEVNCGVNLCKHHNLPWDQHRMHSYRTWVLYAWWSYCRGLSLFKANLYAEKWFPEGCNRSIREFDRAYVPYFFSHSWIPSTQSYRQYST